MLTEIILKAFVRKYCNSKKHVQMVADKGIFLNVTFFGKTAK